MKRDKGHKEVDKRLEILERRLRKEYIQASYDVEKKLEHYLKSFERKDAIKRKQVAEGTITKKEYNTWRFNQIAVGKRWEDMKDNLAKDYANANKIARAMIDDHRADVYAFSRNYGAYEVEHKSLLDINWSMYNKDTVKALMKDDPKLLPDPQPNSKTWKRIQAYEDSLWNKQQIQSVMVQGILQGKSVKDIAKHLAETVGDKNKVSAIRNARTMTTSAQNLGRHDSYAYACSLGIEIEEEWIATLDHVTRDSHRDCDGERKPADDPEATFSNGLRYPADPYGAPAETYNCRCVLQGVIPKYDKSKASDLGLRYSEKLGGMSYEEWKRGGKNG